MAKKIAKNIKFEEALAELEEMKDGAEHTGYLIGKYLRAKIKKELK